jgi:hypothetical protein
LSELRTGKIPIARPAEVFASFSFINADIPDKADKNNKAGSAVLRPRLTASLTLVLMFSAAETRRRECRQDRE